MASKYWLKLFHETIYDPKVMMMSPGARLRWYECLCLAGDVDRNGELPSIKHMAFVFRISEEQLLNELSELTQSGMVVQNNGVYVVKNWAKRQGQMNVAERKSRERDKKQKRDYYSANVSEIVTDSVTNVSQIVTDSVTNSDADIDIDIDKEKEKEINTPSTVSAIPNLYSGDDFVQRVFSRVTGMTSIPRNDERAYIAIEGLRSKYPDVDGMVQYLQPFYDSWITRRGKDGRFFSKTNLAWLTDWAVAGEIPPNTDDLQKQKREIEHRNDPKIPAPDPKCPICGGKGKRMGSSGRYVLCECVHEEVIV